MVTRGSSSKLQALVEHTMFTLKIFISIVISVSEGLLSSSHACDFTHFSKWRHLPISFLQLLLQACLILIRTNNEA